MKIVDTKGTLIYDLPDKPRNFDGWAKGKAYGLEVDGERLTIGHAKDFNQAGYRLTQLRRAYLDGAETFTITEANHD